MKKEKKGSILMLEDEAVGYEHIYDSRILLVDDNAQLRQMVTGILKREGFGNVETAADCRECRERCKREMPDLIILDVGLPDGDGFSLMNEIRKGSGVPVLFLSARDEDSDRLLGLGLGADDYMTKPFLPRELVLRLTAILREPISRLLSQGDSGRTGWPWETGSWISRRAACGKREKAAGYGG